MTQMILAMEILHLGPLECERDCNMHWYNFIERVKFKDIQALKDQEDWVLAGPELRLLILKGSVDSEGFTIVDKAYSSKRTDWNSCTIWGVCNTKWHTMNLIMLKWPEPEMGDRIKIKWLEEDNLFLNSCSKSLTETMYFRPNNSTHVLGTATFSLEGVKCTDMGSVNVYYCDQTTGIGNYYTTGDFEFFVNR
jgi:hypothetical protein